MLIGMSRTRCSRMIGIRVRLADRCRWQCLHRRECCSTGWPERSVGIGEVATGNAQPSTSLRHVLPDAVGRGGAGTLNFDLDEAAKHRLFVIALVNSAVQLAAGRTRPRSPGVS